jgi:hypothetical protein
LAVETAIAGPADDPRALLSSARELTRRVRRAQRGSWFALLVFAALTFASVPAVRYAGHHLDCQAVRGAVNCRVYSEAEFVYWPVALMLAYVLIAAFYVRQSRARGVGTRVRPYAIAGVVIAAALAGAAFWELHDPAASLTLLGHGPSGLPGRLASPAAAIALALLVLARAERSLALLVLALGYLAAVLADVTFSGLLLGVQAQGSWYTLPAAFQGCVLLAGGAGFAMAQRPFRGSAA